MSEDKKDIVVTATDKLDNDASEIIEKLVETKDPQEIQDLTALFNITNTKKNAIRIMRLGELWDTASSELLKRVAEHPDMHCNDDLVKYLSLAESGMDKAAKTLGNVDVTPIIQINQQTNTVNINSNGDLDRDDKLKVMNVVRAILKKANIEGTTTPVDAVVVDSSQHDEGAVDDTNNNN